MHRLRSKIGKFPRVCRFCGKLMIIHRRGQRTCSAVCSNKFYRLNNRAKHAAYQREWHRQFRLTHPPRKSGPVPHERTPEWLEQRRLRGLDLSRRHYWMNRDKCLQERKLNCEQLNDKYLKAFLGSTLRIPCKLIPPEIIELKRNQLLLLRTATQRQKGGK
jgi:hypothetical protein